MDSADVRMVNSIAPEAAGTPADGLPLASTDQGSESDEALMLRYQSGDAHAFEVLYLRHRPRLFRFLLHQTGSQGHAEELFQDIWMGVIRSRERYLPSARFSTFLLTMAHNRVVDHYRRNSPLLQCFENDADGHTVKAGEQSAMDPARQAELNQEIGRLDMALAQLSPEQREIFLLRQESDADLAELALLTGVSRETAKSRLRYAVGHLRRLLGEPA
jgi:RNA polymerase sigma factor (sigma-70 family)